MTVNLLPAGVFDDKAGVLQAVLANEKDYLTTRVSYKLNLRGPSFTVQSGCSTSLVAIHLACQSLLNYESDIALAGGVAVDVSRNQGCYCHEGSVFSPDGHCRAFDAKAKGTVFGNGVGLVALKRLEDAVAQRDCIRAVILGSATNNDGSVKVGFTAPSINGQSKVIVEALADAGVPADTIGYVETHGTGTSLGDPIEVEAMTKAFGTAPSNGRRCAIGSVKASVGHLDAAAGVTGFIKAVLALQHGMVPPSLNCDEPNPKIAFEKTSFYVNTALREWKTGTVSGVPRRAGVSSFGMGGTNAHVVLQEAPRREPSGPSRPWQLLALSARTKSALATATTNLLTHLRARPHQNFPDLAYTMHAGRAVFSHRRTLVCRDTADAIGTLETTDSERVRTHHFAGEACRVAFLFPGQGTQHVAMGRELYESEPTFRQHVDACCDRLGAHIGKDLRGVLYPSTAEPGELEAASERLSRTDFAQPALFVIEYALARLWMEWGVEPVAYLGHGVGEYVAACLGGVFTLEDALRLVAERGRLMQQLPPGAMTAVAMRPEELELAGQLALAATNGPALSVVSGPVGEVKRFEQRLAAQGQKYRRLHTSHGFHWP